MHPSRSLAGYERHGGADQTPNRKYEGPTPHVSQCRRTSRNSRQSAFGDEGSAPAASENDNGDIQQESGYGEANEACHQSKGIRDVGVMSEQDGKRGEQSSVDRVDQRSAATVDGCQRKAGAAKDADDCGAKQEEMREGKVHDRCLLQPIKAR